MLICSALLLACSSAATADEVSVPINLQLELLQRTLRYERAFASERTPVVVLVVSRGGAAESVRVASQFVAGLRRAGSLGGRTTSVTSATYTTPAALRSAIGASHARVVYLSASLGRDVTPMTAALSGLGVVTVSSVGADVARGAVLGFELASSRPRIVVNLAAARAQRLQFNAQFLRLARVIQ
jgi:hypothetical protein